MLEVHVLKTLKPPSKLGQADPLDVELYDMAKAEERGFVRFPPPPPPVDPSALAKVEPMPIERFKAQAIVEREPDLDIGRLITRILICVAFAIVGFSLWYVYPG